QQSVQEARTVPNLAGDRRIVQLELAASQTAARASGRKVRTPQGSAPGNARSGQLEGQWHRKYTADAARRAMVKRCGKSAPRSWQHGRQAKPRTEQGQIGGHVPPQGGATGRPVRRLRVGCLIPPVMTGLEE